MVIYCSKALQTALKLTKKELATSEKIANEEDLLYSWHGHITKVDGRNTLILMNDKTMYSVILRNKLPKNKDNFREAVLEAIPYTFEVGNMNAAEIDKYMSNVGDIVYAEKTNRQISGNMNKMIANMAISCELNWTEEETIQAIEASGQNSDIRKIGKNYIVPFEEMLKELCKIGGTQYD